MQKIKFDLLNSIISDTSLTAKEIDFLIFLCKTNDNNGTCRGVYYKDIVSELLCSKDKFYKMLKGLSDKGYIIYKKNHSTDVDITIIGNNFIVDGEPIYRDYMSLNYKVFYDNKFLKLKAGAKRLLLDLCKRTLSGQKNKLWFIPYNEYKIYSEKLGVSKRVVKDYFNNIRNWVQVAHNIYSDGKEYDVITFLASALNSPQIITKEHGKSQSRKMYEEHSFYIHYIKTFCRRKKIKYNIENLYNTAVLIKQYINKAKENGKSIFNLITKAINTLHDNILNSISVHKIIKNFMCAW